MNFSGLGHSGCDFRLIRARWPRIRGRFVVIRPSLSDISCVFFSTSCFRSKPSSYSYSMRLEYSGNTVAKLSLNVISNFFFLNFGIQWIFRKYNLRKNRSVKNIFEGGKHVSATNVIRNSRFRRLDFQKLMMMKFSLRTDFRLVISDLNLVKINTLIFKTS